MCSRTVKNSYPRKEANELHTASSPAYGEQNRRRQAGSATTYLGGRARRRKTPWRWWAERRIGPARAPRTPPAAATSAAAPLFASLLSVSGLCCCLLAVAPLLEANVAVRSVRDREREQTATACAIIYFFFLYMYQLVSVAACCRAPAPLVPRHAGSCGVVDRIFLGDVTRALNIFSKSSSENEIKIHSEIENLSKKTSHD